MRERVEALARELARGPDAALTGELERAARPGGGARGRRAGEAPAELREQLERTHARLEQLEQALAERERHA